MATVFMYYCRGLLDFFLWRSKFSDKLYVVFQHSLLIKLRDDVFFGRVFTLSDSV